MIVFCFTFRARPTSVAWRHRAMRHRRPAATAHLTSNNWPIRITRHNADDSADVNGAFLRQRISCVEIIRQKKTAHTAFCTKAHKCVTAVCDAIWRLLQTVVYENQTETETKWTDVEVTHRRFLYGSTYYRTAVVHAHFTSRRTMHNSEQLVLIYWCWHSSVNKLREQSAIISLMPRRTNTQQQRLHSILYGFICKNLVQFNGFMLGVLFDSTQTMMAIVRYVYMWSFPTWQ